MSRRPIEVLIIKTSGLVVIDRAFVPSLENFQRVIGGTIECAHLEPEVIRFLERSAGVTLGERACLVCHDEGLLLELPHNPVASRLYGGHIVGDAMVADVP